jgi:predicted transcriptional regulator
MPRRDPPRIDDADRSRLESLTQLGFSDIEARVYLALLRESPQTGYRIARAIGKAAANTYQALESLAHKGAIIVEQGDARQCRAVPPAEVIERLRREFAERGEQVTRELEEMDHGTEDERVYQLRSISQVFERARTMLSKAQRIVIADIFAAPLERLVAAFDDAAARGVSVYVRGYGNLGACKFHYTGGGQADRVSAEAWPGQHLALVVDGREHLIALCDWSMERVHQAAWSASRYLSCLQHIHLADEYLFRLRQQPRETELSIVYGGVPGFAELHSRYRRVP